MGEIAEALRRAHRERAAREEPAAASNDRPESGDDVYSEAARLHDESREPTEAVAAADARRPAPPAPPPAAQAAVGRAGAFAESEAEGVELTHIGSEARAPQGVLVDDGGAMTDSCLQLALRVHKALADRDARTLAVVSALRNEGKTTVSCNLALAIASLGQVERVALVDLDLRRPSIVTVLELTTATLGIEDVLVREEALESACVRVSAPRLDVYPCLHGLAKAHEQLLDPHFERVVDALRERYEIVIFDTPPTLLVPDATIIMQHADCFAPVARAGLTRARSFKRMLEILPRRQLLGTILDSGALHAPSGYYRQYAPDIIESEKQREGTPDGG